MRQSKSLGDIVREGLGLDRTSTGGKVVPPVKPYPTDPDEYEIKDVCGRGVRYEAGPAHADRDLQAYKTLATKSVTAVHVQALMLRPGWWSCAAVQC